MGLWLSPFLSGLHSLSISWAVLVGCGASFPLGGYTTSFVLAPSSNLDQEERAVDWCRLFRAAVTLPRLRTPCVVYFLVHTFVSQQGVHGEEPTELRGAVRPTWHRQVGGRAGGTR